MVVVPTASCMSLPNGGVCERGATPTCGSGHCRLEVLEWDRGLQYSVGGEFATTSLAFTVGVLPLELRELGGAW